MSVLKGPFRRFERGEQWNGPFRSEFGCVRFKTQALIRSTWAVRTVLSGPKTNTIARIPDGMHRRIGEVGEILSVVENILLVVKNILSVVENILSVVEKHFLGRRKTFSRSWGVAVFKNRIFPYVLTILRCHFCHVVRFLRRSAI